MEAGFGALHPWGAALVPGSDAVLRVAKTALLGVEFRRWPPPGGLK